VSTIYPSGVARRVAVATVAAMLAFAIAVPEASTRTRPDRSFANDEAAVAAKAASVRITRFRSHGAPSAARVIKVLGGFTSQGWPIVVEVSGDRKVLLAAGIGIALPCTLGNTVAVSTGAGLLRIGKGGKISGSTTIPASTSDGVSMTGGTNSMTAVLDPKRWRVSGTWQMEMGFSSSTGQTNQCNSGRVTFTAHQ
jgi:hypothetical protein